MSIKLFKVVDTKGVAMEGLGLFTKGDEIEVKSLFTKDFLDDPSNDYTPRFINPSHIVEIRQEWSPIYDVNRVSTKETKMQGKKVPFLDIILISGRVYFYGKLEELQICMANPNNYIELGLPK